MAKPKTSSCDCWEIKNKALEEMGLKLSDACSMMQMHPTTLDLSVRRGIPLQRLDGKRLRRRDPKMVILSRCPFCGKKHTD